MNNIVGINDSNIDKMILNIYDYAEKIAKTLDQISVIVDDTKNFYKSEEADLFRREFNAFSENFETIRKNLSAYATDLLAVKIRYKNMDLNSVNILKKN